MAAKVLVVEGEKLVRRFLDRALTRAGYDVQATSSPEEAIKICRALSIDLVLADAGWEKPNGHDLARWVAVERPNTRVLLMAAWESECEQCPYAPMCGLIQKPFHKGQVLASVADALEGKRIA